jgi:hypothetical protein
MITSKENRKHILFALLLLAALSLLIAGFSGCKPSLEVCNRHYPPQIRDSIAYVELTKLDTSYFIIPGDTIQLRVPIPCPDFNASAGTGKNKVQVIIKDNYLTANCISKEDSIRIVTACQEKEKQNQRTIEVKVPIYKAPTWSWWSLMFNLLFIGLVFIYLKFKK